MESVSGLAFVAALSLSLVACVQPPPVARSAPATRFLCEHGASIFVTFENDSATLVADGKTTRLAQRPAASGIWYAGGGQALRGKGPELTWTDAAGLRRTCREEASALRQAPDGAPLASLAGTSWRLVHFQSSDDAIGTIVPPRLERYTMTFRADGTLALQLDCNRASARWTAEPTSARGGGLSITPGIMTRAMCPPGALDTRIARDLERLRSFTLVDGRLGLALMADGGIYLWEPATP